MAHNYTQEKAPDCLVQDRQAQLSSMVTTNFKMKVESLNEGDAVSYEEEEGRKGKVAAQVVVIE